MKRFDAAQRSLYRFQNLRALQQRIDDAAWVTGQSRRDMCGLFGIDEKKLFDIERTSQQSPPERAKSFVENVIVEYLKLAIINPILNTGIFGDPPELLPTLEKP